MFAYYSHVGCVGSSIVLQNLSLLGVKVLYCVDLILRVIDLS